MDWPALVTAIGASTIGVVSVVTNHPIPVQPPTSILGAAVGTDLRTAPSTGSTGLLVLLGLGLIVFVALRKD